MRVILILCLALITASAARAHEFWIAPVAFQTQADAPILADLKVGQKMSGARYAYLPQNFFRFDLVQGAQTTAVTGRLGDIPALNMRPPEQGLVIVVHETTDRVLSYSDWDKFTAFVTHKDLIGTLEAHAARGLPQSGFSESYRRFAKGLVASGHGQGADRAVGLTTEIVALANPYTDDITPGLPVQVLLRGTPRAAAQVEVFARNPQGQVTVSTLKADAEGRALIPVQPGHDYLLDAVVMEPLQNTPAQGPVWRSLWASLTFAVPQK